MARTGFPGAVYLCGQPARMLWSICYLQLYGILTQLPEFRTDTWSISGDETPSESYFSSLLSHCMGDGTWICSYVQTWYSAVHCCTSSYDIHLIVSGHSFNYYYLYCLVIIFQGYIAITEFSLTSQNYFAAISIQEVRTWEINSFILTPLFNILPLKVECVVDILEQLLPQSSES